MSADERAERRARARARHALMEGDVVPLGVPKAPPYARSSPEERLAAATRLLEHHEALRGPRSRPPRREWPGERFVTGRRGD